MVICQHEKYVFSVFVPRALEADMKKNVSAHERLFLKNLLKFKSFFYSLRPIHRNKHER